jgi:asparagine synthase (glutamine-hydrolysing)
MCGITALLGGRPGDRLRLLRSLTDVLRHRGPDDEGFVLLADPGGVASTSGGPSTPAGAYESGLPWAPAREAPGGGAAGLGHRRLSILDLSPAGHQPMCSRDRRWWIAYNGEIYNYRELRRELEAAGESFSSTSDTEVLLAAYARWGPDCLARLNGMWAFVIYDARERAVFVARDRFGIKPLFYARWDGGLAFASELKSLLELPGLRRRAHPGRLYDYLTRGVTDGTGDTFFEGISQVPAAHALRFPADEPAAAVPAPYWTARPEERALSADEAAERVRAAFLENIRLHLRSDVPVGAALSGGIDSSAIVMGMRHVEGPGLEIHASSYIADDEALSEERWVDLVAGAAGAAVHKVRPDPQELAADLDRLIRIQDEPFGSTSIYAQFRVFQKAREAGIKVMLDGQGADEMLAGYPGYIAARASTLLGEGRVWEAVDLLRRAFKLPGAKRGTLCFQALEPFLPRAFRDLARGWAGRGSAPAWLNAGWFRERGVAPELPPAPPSLKGKLVETLCRSALPMLLRFEDRNSMAFSIESRVPFLTADLVDLVLSLPEEHIVGPDGVTKAVFRRAMRGIVPDAVLDRRDKIGFATPEHRWLSRLQGWVESILRGETAKRIPAIDLKAVEAEWAAGLQGRKPLDLLAWRWINLIRWSEVYGVDF